MVKWNIKEDHFWPSEDAPYVRGCHVCGWDNGPLVVGCSVLVLIDGLSEKYFVPAA